jgi:hypothetical protein
MEAQTGERGALSNTRPSLNEYDFSHPYLLVGVEGFDGIYDGSSDAIRRSFGVLVFDRAYRAPNGRGYVLLRPVCDTDRKVFDTPLANLRTLVVSLSRPNGTLLNNSVDVLNIVSLAYDTRFNLFVRVTCGRYFDRNEFFLGDTIRCSGFDGAGEDSKGGRQLNMYINRLEGHEVVRLGDVNSQGFSNSFYILAPGVYDSGEGSLILDEHTIDVIREIDTGSGAAKHGAVVNMSLQAFVTIKVGCQGPGH